MPSLDPSLFFGPGNTFQKRSVSSPAPVTTVQQDQTRKPQHEPKKKRLPVWPSGDIARYSTRYVCPVSVVTLDIVGYFQTIIWLREYPCVETTSFMFLLHIRLQTCDPVSIQLRGVPESVFQNRMQRSAVPPPEANRPC